MAIMRVTAYRQIVPLENAAQTPDGYIVDETGTILYNAVRPIIDKGFPAQCKGLDSGVIYQFENTLCFACYTHHQHHNFLEALAELAGYQIGESKFAGIPFLSHLITVAQSDSGSFWELFRFSDTRATIGPEACAKLAADFQAFRGKAYAFDKNNDFEEAFYNQYMNWLEAFTIASEYGMVTLD